MASQTNPGGLPLELWSKNPIASISLDAAGLVALADLPTIQKRTVLTGTSTFLDMFVLCPGIHRQQHATELNGAELPACAALTTGYVFRIENPATVVFLQKTGKPGHLVNLVVSEHTKPQSLWAHIQAAWWTSNSSPVSSLSYVTTVGLTFAAFVLVILTGDWWASAVLMILMFSRLCNILVVRRRSQIGWKGVSEPGKKGDLFILLSQDRWIRMQGSVDDLKAVTSGQWMRDMTFAESSIIGAATMLVYLDAALVSNAQQAGKVIIVVLLLLSAGLLGFSNNTVKTFQMFGRSIKVVGEPKAYKRRLLLAEELIKGTGRDDWAIRLGMINPDSSRVTKVVM
ncbi:hypothetical protein MMC30_001770 [Trapelia coarctata]|nr:hypothetical protein [Trapelia coarctata]